MLTPKEEKRIIEAFTQGLIDAVVLLARDYRAGEISAARRDFTSEEIEKFAGDESCDPLQEVVL